MAETTVNVQPAQPQGAQPVAAVPLHFFIAPDGNGVLSLIQGVALVDDQGRAYLPMTEETGKELVSLMRLLITTLVNNGPGGLLPSARSGGLDHV